MENLENLDIQFEDEPIEQEPEIILDPVFIDREHVEYCEFDEEKFQEGLDNISYVCGQITGLVNVGIHPIDALNYLINNDVLKNNLEVSKLNKESNIGVAREQAIQVEKNSL